MSEQEIRNLKKEMEALTESVNQANDVGKKAAEVAYIASDTNRKMATEFTNTLEEMRKNNLLMHEQNTATLKTIQETLNPISEIYDNSSFLWRITKYFFIGISILVGIALSIKQLIQK